MRLDTRPILVPRSRKLDPYLRSAVRHDVILRHVRGRVCLMTGTQYIGAAYTWERSARARSSVRNISPLHHALTTACCLVVKWRRCQQCANHETKGLQPAVREVRVTSSSAGVTNKSSVALSPQANYTD
jgi:hypothetical protein